MTMTKNFLVAVVGILFCLHAAFGAFGFGSDRDKVRLKDIDVLTLRHGQMTTGRRSSPVQQLKCVGGTAGCSSFVPKVVQCYNRGSDGYDIQWECKTDMDNAYRFGNVEVVCEGYDYPDDPYILKGSCGLEYTLDLTKEGYQQQQQGHHDYYGQQQQYQNPYYGRSTPYTGVTKKASSIVGDLIVLSIVAIIIYAIYKTCIASNNTTGYSGNNQDRRDRWGQHRQPPPPGFRDEYMPRGDGDSCSSTYGSGNSSYTGHSGGPGAGTGGGFWTGAATGGILGYLFGSRNNTYYNTPYNTGWGSRWGNGWGTGWGNGWGTGWGNSWGNGWGNSWGTRRSTGFMGSAPSSGGSSTGTRTASGFGGTRRR